MKQKQAQESPLLERQIQFEDYQILDTLHRGSRSSVYRVKSKSNQETFIIKAMSTESRGHSRETAIHHEFNIGNEFQHDNIIQYIRTEPSEHGTILVIEDCKGTSIDSLIPNEGFPTGVFLDIAVQIVIGLGVVHREGVIHRDIKPANLIRETHSEKIKLIDFGSSERMDMVHHRANSTDLVGTLSYMAPEQTGRMGRTIDHRSDLYSLGVTFYELLTGERPFEGGDELELIHAHLARKPIPPSEKQSTVPVALSDITLKLLAKDPADRYQTTSGLLADLEQCVEQWRNHGSIRPFPPGASDHQEGLRLTFSLDPWSEPLGSIQGLFGHSEKTDNHLIVLGGQPGTGKTSFIRTLLTYASASYGASLYGSADAVRTDTPYFPLAQALRSLLKQILTSGQDDIHQWKSVLSSALGKNAKVLEDLLPELALILGPVPDVPDLAPTEAKNRFHLSLLRLVQCLSEVFPFVVLALDDMHLCDRATSELISQLLNHPETKGLILVWALHGSDKDKERSKVNIWDKISQERTHIQELNLSPFTPENVLSLLSRSLYCTKEEIDELAQTVHGKTKGFPFAIQQFLNSLHHEKLLNFDHRNRKWSWDITQIKRANLTDNVAEYLARSLGELPDETQKVLNIAATIGPEFDIELLASICKKTPVDILKHLLNPIRENFLSIVDGSLIQLERYIESSRENLELFKFCFGHESVRRSAYELFDFGARKQNHLIIGRKLKAQTGDEPGEEIFEIVRHLNIAADVMEDQEKLDLAHLNLRAGQLARDQGSADHSRDVLEFGLTLLGEEAWDNHYQLAFETHFTLVEASLLSGDLERVKNLEATIRQRGKSLDIYKPTPAVIAAFTLTGKHQEAINFGQKILNKIGIHIPEKPGDLSGLLAILKIKGLLLGRKTEQFLDYENMTNPRQLLIMDILSALSYPIYMSNPDFFPYILYHMFKGTIRHGLNRVTPLALSIYGLVSQSVFGHYQYGYNLGQIAYNIIEKNTEKEYDLNAILCFDYTISFWKRPFRKTLDSLMKYYQKSMERGDISSAGSYLEGHNIYSYLSGSDLVNLENINKKYWSLLDAHNQEDAQTNISCYFTLFNGLRRGDIADKKPNGSPIEQETLVEKWDQEGQYALLYTWHWARATLFLFLGDLKRAQYHTDENEKYEKEAVGLPHQPSMCFYRALVALNRLDHSQEASKKELLKQLNSDRKKLAKYASECPDNFRGLHLILEARWAWFEKRLNEASVLLQEAIKQSCRSGIIQEEAYAHELAAHLFLEKDETMLAGASFRRAIDLYHRWGATYKAKQLDRSCSQYLYISRESTQTSTETGDHSYLSGHNNLDFLSVTKSALAISQEINMDQLLVRILSICAESAGAELGKLALKTEHGWIIRASFSDHTCQPQNQSLETSQGFSKRIVRYVIRTDQDVVIGDAQTHELFGEDNHVVDRGVKSVICVRLRHKGQTRGLLYLENNLTFGAFTKQRQEVLRVLLSHASVSVENTALYEDTVRLNVSLEKHRDHLEELVEERTQELKEAQTRLIEASRRAGMADVATGVLHNVGNVLNSVNVSSEIIREIVTDSKIDTLERGVEIIEKNQEDLYTFLTEDDRGKKVPLLLRRVTNVLKKEKQDILENADRLTENIEHIKKTVTTQQEYASFSGIVEEFNLSEVVEDAIQINRSIFEENNTKIVREFSEIGSIKSDKHKLLQIVVNLLRNAGHAVHEADNETPYITIQTKKNSENHVQINIIDNGVGISEENLPKIFNYGFTTREGGHGFGLHTSGNSAKELGGKISGQSDGPGKGATFTIQLPVKR